MTNPNDPVYLRTEEHDPETGVSRYVYGLTKRELFAAMAMQGMIAGSPGLEITHKQFGETSVKLADALIVELNR